MQLVSTIFRRCAQIIVVSGCVGLFALWLGWRLSGNYILSVQTGSMLPTFAPHDALLVKRQSASTFRPGDIVSYKNSRGQTVSHRIVIVDKLSGIITTKGDAAAVNDPLVPMGMILGRAVAVLPGVGYALDFVSKPIGLALAVYLPALLIVMDELKLIVRHYRSTRYRHWSHKRYLSYS